MRRRRIRRLLLAIIGLLYLASVPWYREAGPGDSGRLLLGLPEWVAVALACYVAAAVLNAGAWLLTDVRDAPDEREGAPPGEEPPR